MGTLDQLGWGIQNTYNPYDGASQQQSVAYQTFTTSNTTQFHWSQPAAPVVAAEPKDADEVAWLKRRVREIEWTA